MPAATVTRLLDNLARVRERIAAAAAAAGRSAEEVTLVAVTKYATTELAGALADAGCRDLGESRAQELARKCHELRDPAIHWHFIGHLQRNKAAQVAARAAVIHAVDSERLLAALVTAATDLPRPLPVLLEVNISGDASKHGFAPHELPEMWPRLASLGADSRVEIRGLMGMSGLHASAAEARLQFDQVRLLRDALTSALPAAGPLPWLSLGMSEDFEAAILAGATHVRIGSALYEGIMT